MSKAFFIKGEQLEIILDYQIIRYSFKAQNAYTMELYSETLYKKMHFKAN